MDRNLGGRIRQRNKLQVALRKESVDRNSVCNIAPVSIKVVALRKESVDRNPPIMMLLLPRIVALRKESVDRNFYYANRNCDWVRSLSARRAWIEIRRFRASLSAVVVALRKESVDRNNKWVIHDGAGRESLSARRAWIEIFLAPCYHPGRASRSPQGERG